MSCGVETDFIRLNEYRKKKLMHAVVSAEQPTEVLNQWVSDACERIPQSVLDKAYESAPGSDVAILFGCVCDIMENRGGLGCQRLIANNTGTWMVSYSCPIHKALLGKKA